MTAAAEREIDGEVGSGLDSGARQAAFMSALVTEHFVLQSAASTTVSEAAGRAALYLSVLSSSLIAMGFTAQIPGMLAPFAATVLPAVLIIGVFTVVRLVETGVQNIRFLAGIARVRAYYRSIDPAHADFFLPWGVGEADRAGEALAVMSVRRGRLLGLGTTASMVAVINSIVAGAGVALLVAGVAGGPIPLAVACGVVTGVLCMVVFHRYQDRRYAVLHER